MANAAKKTTSVDVKDTSVKTAEKPAEVKAAEIKTEAAAKTDAPKNEKKTEAKKPGRKPAAKKETAAKAEKKPAAKKETAKKEAAAEKKPAAKKTAAKKTEAAAKPAVKRGRPAAAKVEEKAAPAKRGAKKKQLSYEDIVEATRKKALAADITKIKYPIAANVVISGNFSENKNADGDNKNVFYIVVNPETENIAVEPYKYNDYDVEISADAEELMNVVKAKKNIYDALSDGEVHIHGTTKKAVLLIHAVF